MIPRSHKWLGMIWGERGLTGFVFHEMCRALLQQVVDLVSVRDPLLFATREKEENPRLAGEGPRVGNRRAAATLDSRSGKAPRQDLRAMAIGARAKSSSWIITPRRHKVTAECQQSHTGGLFLRISEPTF